LGAYQDKIQLNIELNSVTINFKFINVGSSFEFVYTLAAYRPRHIKVDCAAPGVAIKQEAGVFFETEVSRSSLGYSYSLGLFGASVRYDPTAVAMKEVAEEIHNLRTQFSEASYLNNNSDLRFRIRINSVEVDKKISVLKVVRQLTNIGLADAKHFVESVPAILPM
jgi:hypothetical protein